MVARSKCGGMAESPAMLTLLRNARIHAPEALGLRDLIVADRRIHRVVEPGTVRPDWPGVEVYDLEGATVIPALVDLHAHVTGGGGEAGPGSRIAPLPVGAYLDGGIGTVVGLLGTDDVTRSTASLVAWTRELSAGGVTGLCMTGGYHLPPTTLTGTVRGDIALVDVIVGVGEIAVSDHRSSQPTVHELRRIAADAHVAGLMTGKAGILHLHMGDGEAGLAPVREALRGCEIPPRVFHPTHVNRRRGLFQEALELVREGCTIDVTAFPVGPDEDAWSAAEAIRLYAESGLPADRLTVSSDAGGCLPVFDAEGRVVASDVGRPSALLDTLGELLRDGLEPEAALRPFTINPANLLRLPHKGRLCSGADADLLVLDRDFCLAALMLGGRWRRGRFPWPGEVEEVS